jgi:hypothetical protein
MDNTIFPVYQSIKDTVKTSGLLDRRDIKWQV